MIKKYLSLVSLSALLAGFSFAYAQDPADMMREAMKNIAGMMREVIVPVYEKGDSSPARWEVWEYAVSADGRSEEAVRKLRDYVMPKPVPAEVPKAAPTLPTQIPLQQEDRRRLTAPVLTAPIPAAGVLPRQTLPPGVPAIPPQAVMPKDPKDLKFLNCVPSFGGGLVGPNPSFSCTYNGVTYTYPKFGNGNADNLLQKIDAILHATERKDINPYFEDIQAFYTQGKPVPFNTALPYPMPAVSVPRFYTREMMAQLNAGVVTTKDGSPLSENTLRIDLMLQQPGYLAAYVMTELWDKDTTNARNGQNHEFMVPYIMKKALPKAVFPGAVNGQPSIPQIFQGQQGPASRPVAPIPSTGGLGSPVGGGGSVTSGGSFIGSVNDWIAQNPILGRGDISGYIQAALLKGGAINNGVSSPQISPDGKALYFYFTVNGIPFAIVVTDTNKDGAYEAHPVLLKYDPKFPGIAFPIYEFANEKEMKEVIINEIRSRTLSTPARK